MPLKGAPSARVGIPQGDLYPSGLPVIEPAFEVQATARPENWLFIQSQGFHTIRPGAHRYQDAYRGPGIGFSPLRYAEDVSAYDTGRGLPAIVSQEDAFLHGDIADLPGSEYLTSDGKISSSDDVQANRGTMIGTGRNFRHHDGVADIHSPLEIFPDMGDRDPDRPLTRSYLHSVFMNPLGAFKDEYASHPVTAIVVAGLAVTLAYHIGKDLDAAIGRRGGIPKGVAGGTVETGGRTTEKASHAVGDVIKDIGDGVNKVADTVADALS